MAHQNRAVALRHALLLTTALSGCAIMVARSAHALDVVVTNLNDSGAGSLRDAINQVNASVDPANNITFQNGFQGVITLLSDLPIITKPVNIDFKGDPLVGGNRLAGAFGPQFGAAGQTVAVNGFHDHSGSTAVSAGTVSIGGPLDGATAGTFFAQRSLLVLSGGAIFDIPVNKTAGFENISGGGTIQNNGSGNGLSIFGLNSSTATFSGSINGTGQVTFFGGGQTTTFSGTNTYSGQTFLAADISFNTVSPPFTIVLAAGAANAFSPNSQVVMNGRATLRLNNFDQTIASLDSASLSGGVPVIELGSARLTTGGDNATTNYFGTINGTGGITKTGTGVMTLTTQLTPTITSVIDYSGTTSVQGGTLKAGNANAFSANSTHALSIGTTLDLASFNQTIGALSGDGAVALGSATLTTGGNNASTAYTGSISGTGGLTKAGTGTMTLFGIQTYTGATNINGGTLTPSLANTFSPLSAFTVASGATFALANHSQIIGSLSGAGTVSLGDATLTTGGTNASTTFSGAITGAGGSLVKTGAGVFTLEGANTYTGTTNVNGGTLIVNSTIANSGAVSVNSGATLGGIGTVGPTTVNAGGALSPGNSIGTISIAGNLTFVGAGNYIVEVSPTAADRTNATGTASLGGTLQAIGTGGAGYTAGKRYTVLNATGGVSGTFGLAASGNFGATKPHLEYDANNVYIVLDPNAISPFIVGGTPNQRAVAGAVDTALQSGNQAAPFLALFGLTPAQLPGALDQLSGEVHVSTAGVLADESRYMREAVLGRMRQASYGGNTSMASLSVGGPQAFAGGEELSSALAYAKSPIVTKAPPMVAPTYDVTFWAQGFGARGRFDSDGNAASVKRDLAGFISGVDTRIGGNGRLGIAAGYTGSKNALDGRGNADVETAHIAGYGGWNLGSFNLRAGGAYAFHSISTDRLIAFPGFFDRTTANYDGHTGQIFGELGYGFAMGNLAIEPFAGAAWVRVKTDARAERGGLAALNVAGTAFETSYATLGIRAASIIPLANDMILIPRGTLAWQHAFDSVTPAGVLAFQVAPAIPFTIAGVPIARDSALAEAGLDLAIGRNATLGVSYIGQFGNNVQDHGAKGKFSYRF